MLITVKRFDNKAQGRREGGAPWVHSQSVRGTPTGSDNRDGHVPRPMSRGPCPACRGKHPGQRGPPSVQPRWGWGDAFVADPGCAACAATLGFIVAAPFGAKAVRPQPSTNPQPTLNQLSTNSQPTLNQLSTNSPTLNQLSNSPTLQLSNSTAYRLETASVVRDVVCLWVRSEDIAQKVRWHVRRCLIGIRFLQGCPGR